MIVVWEVSNFSVSLDATAFKKAEKIYPAILFNRASIQLLFIAAASKMS
jgi:hypothetical protein